MGIMLSPILRQVRAGTYLHWCPGCKERHLVWTSHVSGIGPTWEWNGLADKPTFVPSVRHDWGNAKKCHYFIKDGQIRYCEDSTHALSGKTVDMVPIPIPTEEDDEDATEGD